jgi:hypothetical protein
MQVTVKLSDAELLLVSTELERVMYIEEPTVGWEFVIQKRNVNHYTDAAVVVNGHTHYLMVDKCG